jgi:hypothetical protein
MVFQLLQVAQRGQGSSPAEAVEPLEHHQVELLLVGLQQQGLELGAYLVEGTVLLGKGTQLVQLVFNVLTFVFG